jgi:hypothetical protein
MTITRKNKYGLWVVLDSIDVDRGCLEGNIPDIIGRLELLKSEAESKGMVDDEGYIDICLQDTYYDDKELEIKYYFDRVETDKEKDAREKVEAKVKADAAADRKKKAEQKKLKADAEFAEYERLKAKFGDL